MKCDHYNAEIIEVYITHATIADWGGDDEGNTLLRTEVYCPDCGLDKRYYKNLPRWLSDLTEERKSTWP